MKTKTTQQELALLSEEELRGLLCKLTDDLQSVREALNARAGYNIRLTREDVVAHSETIKHVPERDIVKHEELHKRAAQLFGSRKKTSPTLSYMKTVKAHR